MPDLKPGFEGIRWTSSTLVEKFSPDQSDYAQSVLGHTPQGDELTLLCGLPEEGVHEDSETQRIEIIQASDVAGCLDETEWKQVDGELRARGA